MCRWFGRRRLGLAVDMLATWCVRKLRGDARPSPYRVLSVAPGRRVWRAREEATGWCGQLGADGQNERSSSLTHHSHELVSRRGPSSVLWAISSFVGWLWGGCGVATNCVVTQARCLGASQAFKAAKLQSCYPAVRSRSAPVRRSSTYFYWS